MAYLFTNKLIFTKSGSDAINSLIALLPVPMTHEYQTILKVYGNAGELIKERHYGNGMLYLNRSSLPSGQTEFFAEYYAQPIAVKTDFSQITEIKPYNTESEAYQLHLGNCDIYIDTTNEDLRTIGDQLWKGSSDVLDYARRCYDYVTTHIEFDEFDDWHSLKRILNKRVGGSADLTTLYVNLLRYKGIPCRHNVCVSLSQYFHTFADFYLEGYGWIPVDIANKKLFPSGDYFGYYDGNCIVLSQGIGYDVPIKNFEPIYILPTYYFTYTSRGDDCQVTAVQDLINGGYSGIRPVITTSVDSVSVNYDLNGRKVSDTYKGIVISKGKKYLKR